MNSTYYVKKPFLTSIILVIIFILFSKIIYGFSSLLFGEKVSRETEWLIEITNYTLLSSGIIYLYFKTGLIKLGGFKLNTVKSPGNLLLCLPILLIFGSNGIENIKVLLANIENYTFGVFFVEQIAIATFEELLFRGLILALFLIHFIEKPAGIIKAVLYSSLIFGLLHFLNLISQSELINLQGAISQVYAATCIGFMFASLLIVIRNIYVTILVHLFINLSLGIPLSFTELFNDSIGTASSQASTINSVISLLLTIIIMGLPLLIGLIIIRYGDHDPLLLKIRSFKEGMNRNKVPINL